MPTPTPYKIYMVFESVSTEGKYIPLLYTATDKENENAILPSDATTYTFPAGSGIGEKSANHGDWPVRNC